MDNIYLVSFVISTIFFILKFIEMRFIIRENVALKTLLINTVLVYLSVVVGYYLVEQFDINTKNLVVAPVFVDNPGF